MKKNLIIVFLAIISIASLVFGYTQKEKADEQEALVMEYSQALTEKERQEEIFRKLQEKAIEEAQEMQKKAELAQKNNNSTD